MSRLIQYLPLTALLVACGDPIKHVELIEEPRVLAARAEVMGDEERAAPNPGETVRLRWLVAAPEGDPLSGFSLEACAIPEHAHGFVSCADAPFARGAGDASQANPEFSFTLPADWDAEAQPRVAVLGNLCANGAGAETGCATGVALPVSFDSFLAGAERTNMNPNIPAEAIALDGVTWPSGDMPSGACSGLGLPEISLGGGQHQIQISLPDSVREALPRHSSVDAAREELRISHFSSLGELERPFSEILPEETAVSASVGWKPPKSAAPDGELVRFWFVVRDLRGGSDFTERALCLLP
jgi:hypothetical protein